MKALPPFLSTLADLRKTISALGGTQIFSVKVRGQVRALAQEYFSSIRTAALAEGVGEPDLSAADGIFQNLNVLSHKSASKAKCLSLLKDGRACLIQIEARALSKPSAAGARSATDELVLSSLKEICPAAALAYEQAINDLQAGERFSWRGPATDLREALRETLDILAPDAEVEKSPGYKPEADLKRPSMKQKTRFILKARNMNTGQLATSETAVSAIEEGVSGITRSVYTRSNVSTHTPTSREEVVRLHAWVRLVMCELLALPIGG